MSRRTHVGLRLVALALLVGVAAWPRPTPGRRAHSDRAVLRVAAAAHRTTFETPVAIRAPASEMAAADVETGDSDDDLNN